MLNFKQPLSNHLMVNASAVTLPGGEAHRTSTYAPRKLLTHTQTTTPTCNSLRVCTNSQASKHTLRGRKHMANVFTQVMPILWFFFFLMGSFHVKVEEIVNKFNKVVEACDKLEGLQCFVTQNTGKRLTILMFRIFCLCFCC